MSHIPVPLIIRRDKGWDPAGREAIEAIERRRICGAICHVPCPFGRSSSPLRHEPTQRSLIRQQHQENSAGSRRTTQLNPVSPQNLE